MMPHDDTIAMRMGAWPVVLSIWLAAAAAAANPSNGYDGAVLHFREYLRIRTAHPFPQYTQAVEFLSSLGRSIGFDPIQVQEFVQGKPVLVLTWQGSEPSLPSVLLNSHMDVVSASLNEWTHDPFEGFIDEHGDIYGRGAQDTKCIGIQYLEAVRSLIRDGFKPLRTIHVSFVPDEEVGGADGFGRFVKSELFSSLNVGVALDEGLASISDVYTVTNAERSPWWLQIKAVGQPGHGSRLYEGSAMVNMIKSLEAIRQFRSSQFDLVKAGLANEGEVTSVNPVYLKAGHAADGGFTMNVQASEVEAGFDMRVQPGADTAYLEKLVSELWAPSARNMSYKYLTKADDYGYTPANERNPWWGLLVNAIQSAGGKIDGAQVRPSTTDGRFLRNVGIPTFGFSPIANTPMRLHSANEFLNVKEFKKGVLVYKEVIKSYGTFNESLNSIT